MLLLLFNPISEATMTKADDNKSTTKQHISRLLLDCECSPSIQQQNIQCALMKTLKNNILIMSSKTNTNNKTKTNRTTTIEQLKSLKQSHHRHNNNNSSLPSNSLLIIFPSLICLALTGVVCTHKIQAEEECLSSNVLCYECDSKTDPNCADPFDFSPEATLPATLWTSPDNLYQQQTYNSSSRQQLSPNINLYDHNNSTQPHNNDNSTIPINQPPARIPKKYPNTAVCHGCCVKLTSKLPDGSTYVKRTCTTNLQINYFIIALVCMKESGDRGKMCFCETDYCNGQESLLYDFKLLSLQSQSLVISSLTFIIARFIFKIDR